MKRRAERMSCSWTLVFLGASVLGSSQQSAPTPSQDLSAVLAAVSRDDSMLNGGLGAGRWTGRGTVVVEPLARLTPSGEWKSLPCGRGHLKTCAAFEHEYLNKPHTYTVVTAEGHDATIHAAPTALSECYSFTGTGSYSGASIEKSAIAASSAHLFVDSPPPQPLDNEEAGPVRKALAVLIPRRLDSTQHLRLFALRLEGQDMIVVQRAFADRASAAGYGVLKFIFAIGAMDGGRFHILHWKQNSEDEEERVLGTIQLKSGRNYLITTVCDPESQWFRVYGIRDGHLALIYSGGGSSC